MHHYDLTPRDVALVGFSQGAMLTLELLTSFFSRAIKRKNLSPLCPQSKISTIKIGYAVFFNFMTTPDYVFSSDKETKRLVFLLHGYGSNGANLLEIGHFWAPSLRLTTFISPNAHDPWEAGPFGYQWFSIPNHDLDPKDMRKGLDYASEKLSYFIHSQMHHYDLTPRDVALVGFSQGAMLALEMMFHIPDLAGIISYSGAFYPPSKIKFKGPYPPVLLVHGALDPSVPYTLMAKAKKDLEDLGCEIETETGPALGHSIDMNGLHRGLEFIQKIFTKNSPILAMNNNSAEI